MKKTVLYRGQKYKILAIEKIKYGVNEVTMLTLNNKKYNMKVNEQYVIYC